MLPKDFTPTQPKKCAKPARNRDAKMLASLPIYRKREQTIAQFIKYLGVEFEGLMQGGVGLMGIW